MTQSVATEASPTEAPRAPSFEEFFLSKQATLFRALWLVTRNRHEAEEVMQDAFLKMLERRDRVAGLDDPVGYLYRTAMNLLRSRRRRAMVAVRRAVGLFPSDDLAAVEQREEIIRMMAVLSPRQRAALVLTVMLEFTSEEAGRALGISATTVRVPAARGRATLRNRTEGPA